MTKCYECKHADFKTAAQKQMGGFCFCLKLKTQSKYLPSCHVCELGKFEPAAPETMEARKRFFRSLGEFQEGI